MLNPLRIKLQETSFTSLKNIKYDNYEVLLFGEQEKTEGKLHFIKAPEGRKGDRLKFALRYISQNKITCDHLCRFDDDNLINPNILSLCAALKNNAIADQYHSFFT